MPSGLSAIVKGVLSVWFWKDSLRFLQGFFLSDLVNVFSIWSTDGCRVRVCKLWVLGVRTEDSYESCL